jgi:alkanesulfonate monooxygenase SsuD/methylene tetrahydromethanopterin reductase-like flavin-dependent oxidoreductase (luciferase family)
MQVFGKALSFDAVADAQRAEAAGYDGVRVIDHFFSGIPPEQPTAVPHAFVTLAAAAVATERVLLTQTMIAATFRHPAEVAQAVACLDRLSGGRAELGIGTGWLPAEHDALGLSLGTPRERVDRAVEAATICRQMFQQQGCVDFDGVFFVAHSDATWPATPHVPEILVGAHGPRLVRAAAAVADRIDLLEAMRAGRPLLEGVDANDEVQLSDRISRARAVADSLGRDVRFSATVNLTVGSTVAERDAVRRELATAAGCEGAVLDRELLRSVVTADEAIGRFECLRGLGIDRVHVRPSDPRTQLWLDEHVASLQALG